MAAPKLGDFLTSINKTKHNMMRDPNAEPQVITGYPAFMIRRLMSYHQDAVLYANQMNKLPHLDNQMQYEYLLAAVPKRNRYASTHKIQNPDALDLVKRFYNYSDSKALEVYDLHSTEDLEAMRMYFDEGGLIK